MALANNQTSLKTADDLMNWLEEEVSPSLPADTEALAHGGTALTLLGLKDFTKDVDFGFRTREWFDNFVSTLQSQGYEITRDYSPNPAEVHRQLRHQGQVVDVVDLRFPTWNRWRITDQILKKALVLRMSLLRLVRPDRDTIFLFKTYPLRARDLEDLQRILKNSPPDETVVIDLFEEQDLTYRRELLDEQLAYEPLINILELRTRFAGSLSILEAEFGKPIQSVIEHAQNKFLELDLPATLDEMLPLIRQPPVDWDELLGEGFEVLRGRLAT